MSTIIEVMELIEVLSELVQENAISTEHLELITYYLDQAIEIADSKQF